MKALLISTALVAGLALPISAQETASSPFQAEAMGPSVSASDIIGARLYASEAALDADAYNGVQEGWNDIGEVNDIVLSRDGSVDAVLVDIGGFLGMGERKVAVDMSALRFVQDDATDADDWFLVLQADRAMLDSAPEWTLPGANTRADAAATDKGGLENVPVVNEAISGDQTAANAETGMASRDGYKSIERNALTSEMLSGVNVYDSGDNSIAEISDFVLTAEGQVSDVVLDVGGFLGMGEKTVAIPMDRLTVAQDEGGAVRVWVDMTKEELEALPAHAK